MLAANASGFFPYTPATNLLFGLREALRDAGRGRASQNVFARHGGWPRRRARPCGRWELEIVVRARGRVQPGRDDRDDARRDTMRIGFRALVLERFNMSLGAGLGRLKGRAFRIGHLGDFNDLMLMGTLCGVEMGLDARRRAVPRGGVDAALDSAAAGARRGDVSGR